MKRQTEWVCIACEHILGNIYGGEFYPSVEGKHMHTSGPNLVVTCPECGAIKTFYTSDPIVRSIYQLVSAMSEQMAKATVHQIGREMNTKK